MKATELTPGKIYRDIETVKSATYLEFVKYDGDTPLFRYAGGDRGYLADSDGLIGFCDKDDFYEVGKSELKKLNKGGLNWFRSLINIVSIKQK